jgi:DNA-binding winged helix-turn-helix (wHTH) protein
LTSANQTARIVRFGTFEVDLRSEELRKGDAKLKLSRQPFQILAMLLEQPGEIVTREELQKRLWPDTFVDVDHSLNTAINKISARYWETQRRIRDSSKRCRGGGIDSSRR